MAQRLDTWQNRDWQNRDWQNRDCQKRDGQNGGARRWLSLLVEAMEEAARPEVRSRPCETAILNALRAQLARPAMGYRGAPSIVRH